MNTRRNILLLEASRKVIGAPDVALAMRKHVWRVFAVVGQAKTKARVIVGLQVQCKSSSMGRGGISASRACVRALFSRRRRSEEPLQMAVVGEGVVCYVQGKFVQEARQVL